jgi:hypothetical protein
MSLYSRKKKLVQPRFQLRLIGFFMGLSALGLLLQFLLLGARLSTALSRLDDGGAELAEEVPAMMLEVLGFSIVIVLPIVFCIGLMLTFRIAGSAYRMESYLRTVARGEAPEPLRLRENDELQSLCEAVNAATVVVRARRPETAASDPQPQRSAA